MKAYENIVANKIGTFPSVLAKNASGAGATDGTEYVADLVNDLWGFWQTVLQFAGQTPNGTLEASAATAASALGNAQQKLQSMQMLFGAPGELVFDCITPGSGTYGSQSMVWGAAAGGPPTRYQYRRVIACAGQTVAIASYPDLAAAIYCGDANNATADYGYKSSDAGGVTHSTSGTYIGLPDFRGVTVRGYDHGHVHDPQGATRGVNNAAGLLASLQQDAFQGHLHAGGSLGMTITLGGSSWAGGYIAVNNVGTTEPTPSAGPISDGTDDTPRTTTETRMYNASCNISIRY